MAGVKAQGAIKVTYDSLDMTQYLDSTSLEATVNQIDVTTFASTGTEQTQGTTDWSVEVGGNWAFALDTKLGDHMINTPSPAKNLVVEIGKATAKAIYTWTANAFISNYRIEARDPAGVIKWTGTLSVSGAPARSVG